MQGRILAYRKSKYSKHITHRILHTNVWPKKKIILLQKKYSPPQSTKGQALSTSKKESKKWWNMHDTAPNSLRNPNVGSIMKH
jgi:hypothetical protein